MKIRFSEDQKAAISILAKRADLKDSTFVRQLVHQHLLANHQIYAKQIYAKVFPEESRKIATSQRSSDALTRRNTQRL